MAASHTHVEPEKPVVYEPYDLRGRRHVEKVASEYRVREDQCLADKLQSEEFLAHFGKNKFARQLGQMDINTAKEIYLKEAEESGLLSTSEMKKLCGDDKFIAEELTKRIDKELILEAERKIAAEMQDEEFARYLEAKEREKLENERKRALERRIAQDRAHAKRLQSQNDVDSTVPKQSNGWAIDFEVGTSEGVKTGEELKALRDASVARSLQIDEAEKEAKKLEEEQDRRIAMRLQQVEAEEYRKSQADRQRRREMENKEKEVENRVNEKRKYLQSVDATGMQVQSDKAVEAPAQHAPLAAGGENVYLTAVDATGHPVEGVNGNTLADEQRLIKKQLLSMKKQSRKQTPDDPTYASIPSKSVTINETPVTIVQNVKRESFKDESKKKKKWFSKKEK